MQGVKAAGLGSEGDVLIVSDEAKIEKALPKGTNIGGKGEEQKPLDWPELSGYHRSPQEK